MADYPIGVFTPIPEAQNQSSLIKYDAARTALAECKAVDEVKDWLDKSAAVQAYGRMAKDKTLEIDAAEIRIRAERRLGEVLAEQKANGGFNRGSAGLGINHHTPHDVRSSVTTAPKLSDMGISKDLSSRSQKLAAVPADEFESEVSEWRDRVGQENARVTARLEKAGEKVLKKQNKTHDIEAEEENQSREELYGSFDPIAELEAANTEIDRLTKIIEADDSLAEANKEIKRLSSLCETQQYRINSLMSEKVEAVRHAQRYKHQLDKLEKQVKAAGLEDF